jgi:hypothetical protein
MLQLQEVEQNVRAILQQEKSVQLINVKELVMLLVWHQAPKVTSAKKSKQVGTMAEHCGPRRGTSFVFFLDE